MHGGRAAGRTKSSHPAQSSQRFSGVDHAQRAAGGNVPHPSIQQPSHSTKPPDREAHLAGSTMGHLES